MRNIGALSWDRDLLSKIYAVLSGDCRLLVQVCALIVYFAGIKNFGDCVKACCDDLDCNAVFFTKMNCLTIECKSDELCSPGERSDALDDAVLINLRTVGKLQM